ncbi:hypothetical protein QJQ45_029692 [Haematococcus lacustris]|nr:hypothetical protein QJQ45_029692 [Haematococcus lacustris]
MPGHAQQRLNRKIEPDAPLPPQPPELTARYNKKLLTLEEIVQAHANSVHAQKYSIEVVGGKIKAVCNDCKVALSCGNLSDAKRHQCNKRPRSGQDATDADVASNDMPFERITACWNPAQRMPANIMTEFWRRIHMWFIDAEIPFAKDAEEWVLEVSRDNPQWTLGVLDLLRERLAKGYWPVMPAAYVLDGVNFAPPKDNLNASPQPPFGLLSPQEKEDAITTVARLSKHLRPDLTDSQVKQAVQREVDVLQLGGWGDSELERFAALLAPKPPDAASRVAVEPISMRRAFWGKAGPRGFPNLAVAASRLLGVHATSAASERNWSAWGRLFTSARTRLTLERAKMLIYIKANAGLGARHNTEAQLLARMGE